MYVLCVTLYFYFIFWFIFLVIPDPGCVAFEQIDNEKSDRVYVFPNPIIIARTKLELELLLIVSTN